MNLIPLIICILVVLIKLNQRIQPKSSTNVRYVREIIGRIKNSFSLVFRKSFFASKWLNVINNQRVGNDVHEAFHRELDNNPDKFGVIAEYLGRRLFDKVIIR